jgi:trigger factor
MIENLREQKPTFASVEREARTTDRVTVDFNGTIDGQPFEGGSGENIPIVLGAGRMLADFEAGLMSARAGEQRTIALTFPQNYGAPALAGKRASHTAWSRAASRSCAAKWKRTCAAS